MWPRWDSERVLLHGIVALCLMTGSARALDASLVPAPKRTVLQRYYSAREAADAIAQSPATTLFLDVRTPAEVTFVGMPKAVDANVPYMIPSEFPQWDPAKNTFKLEPNPNFIAEVRRHLKDKELDTKNRVVLICRSGDRSAAAANLLAAAGFENVYTVVDGFEGDLAKDGSAAGQRVVNGWKNANLPWTYTLDRNKMYQIDK